jgi:recombination associated protein RdgC
MKPMELVEQGRFLGEEFLLWLWMRGLAEGGTSGLEGDQSACFVDDAVQLVTERGDVKELSLRKGNPAESREAFEALSRGMRPAKAKVRLLSGDMEWTFTLSAAGLEISTLKLPPTQSKDNQGRVADRLFLLEEGMTHLERRFEAFLSARTQDPDELQEALRAWLRQGLEGLVGAGAGADDLPWQG